MGHSGTGKSHLINKYVDANPSYVDVDKDGAEIDIRPVIIMEMPFPFSAMEFYNNLVYALGGAKLERDKIGDVTRQAFTLIQKQKVEMIIIDEMNYIEKGRSIKAMELIKYVANVGQVSMVYVGTPVIDKLRTLDFEYLHRYPVVKLEPYKECDRFFIEFLGQLERQLNPKGKIGLSDLGTNIPQLLYESSQGIIGLVTQILIEAYRLAGLLDNKMDQYPELTIELLEEAKHNIFGYLSVNELEKMII